MDGLSASRLAQGARIADAPLMLFPRGAFCLLAALAIGGAACAQELRAVRLTPNLAGNIDRPLRYRPDGDDFVIRNGVEFFNRPLYGGNTAFRVDGGDKPEFVLYLPGRGGNLRFGVRSPAGIKWLHDAATIETRYRPGELRYEIRDPVLGPAGRIQLVAVAYAQREGLGIRIEAEGLIPGTELLWAYGGVNGVRGKRDGDIGTESVPISEWFQLRPEFCRGNEIEIRTGGFELRAKAATLVGSLSVPAIITRGDAKHWNDLKALLIDADGDQGAASSDRKVRPGDAPALSEPVVFGRVAFASDHPVYLSLDRRGSAATAADLDVYREVTAPERTPSKKETRPGLSAESHAEPQALSARFAEAEQHFATLRHRVTIDTPDKFLNAAVGALNVAADAVWDQPQHAIMHGAIAWRTRLLGWRGPYALDALGWHDRFEENARYWFGRQNTDPIPSRTPPPDEGANLARNEAGLHTNGDLSHSHYDMNLVFIDAVFRHLEWTGNLDFARAAWPVIEAHLAWEHRLFRREFGPEKLPLYEAYAAIWASDDLQYSGGGAMHASAYNYYENRQAARLARLLGHDPAPYEHEADLLARGMRQLLWVTESDALSGAGSRTLDLAGRRASTGWFAESKDRLGLQRVHPSAALWTFYHTVDSAVPTPREAWQMADYVAAELPHLPVRGAGVPDGLCTLGTTNWMPYDWSINNVVMAEAVHGALGLWQAGRGDEAWAVLKGSILAAMFMGISPGNVGSMSYLDVYRRESQRDFADGSGVLSRALVEGLFGVKVDALAGEITVTPGWPISWSHARIEHPDFALDYVNAGTSDRYVIDEYSGNGANGASRSVPLALKLRVAARRDRIAGVLVNGRATSWKPLEDSIGRPCIEVVAPPAGHFVVAIEWSGDPERLSPSPRWTREFRPATQGEMRWLQPVGSDRAPRLESAILSAESVDSRAGEPGGRIILADARFDPVALTSVYNDQVTQIFRHEYRSPRSPFVSLALPKQGLGGWAGGVNRSADIDDSGLRETAAHEGGRIVLPNGVPFVIPTDRTSRNVVFTSQWDNYPREVTVPLTGLARGVYLLMAGSTNPMQSRIENGEVIVTYFDGSTDRLPLVNPTNWWPIEQDYFVDDFQFLLTTPLPVRVNLKTGQVRELDARHFKGTGGAIPGGAATVLVLPLDDRKQLKSLMVRTTANDVVVGLMAATLVR